MNMHPSFGKFIVSQQPVPAAHVLNTAKGVVVRYWVPGAGWHFADWDTVGRQYLPAAPCDPTALTEYIKAI